LQCATDLITQRAHGAGCEACDEHPQADRVVVAGRDLPRAAGGRPDGQDERAPAKKFQIRNWLSFMFMAPDTAEGVKNTAARPRFLWTCSPLGDGVLPHLQGGPPDVAHPVQGPRLFPPR
jgi:hypothetical protein